MVRGAHRPGNLLAGFGAQCADQRVSDPRVVFLFEASDLYLFPSLADAEDWLEAVDVDCDEYTAALTETGRVIRMRTDDEEVVLELTETVDPATLRELLRAHGELIGEPGIELDPVGFANRSWLLDRDSRWPKWPRWLDRRVHPRGPTQA